MVLFNYKGVEKCSFILDLDVRNVWRTVLGIIIKGLLFIIGKFIVVKVVS